MSWEDVKTLNKLVRYVHHTADAVHKLSKMDMGSVVMMAFSDAAFVTCLLKNPRRTCNVPT